MTSPDPLGMRLRSGIRGRERWEVKALSGKSGVARELEEALLQHAGVLQARANPVSGRVLVLYRPSTPGLNVESLIRNSLREILFRPVLLNPDNNPTSALQRILKTSLPPQSQRSTAPLLSAIGHSLHLLQGLSFVSMVNTARGKGPGFLGAFGLATRGSRLIGMTVLSLFVTGADLFVQYYRKRAWRRLGQTTQHNLREQLITRIETQDIEFFDRYGNGPLINLVNKDTKQIGDFVGQAGDIAIEKALTIIVSGAFLIAAAPSLALLAFLPLPFILLTSRFFSGKISERYAYAGETANRFSQMLENNLSGIEDVKSFTAEAQEIRRLSECDARAAQYSLEAERVASLQSQTISGFFSTGFLLTAGYGGVMTAAGTVSLSSYIRLVYWFPQLLRALTGIDQVSKLYYTATDSAQRLAKVMDSHPRINSGPVRLPAGNVRGEIIFEDVSFGYHPSVKVLENVSFHLRPGETLAIVGPTGSGKSTLLRLLLRYFDADSGRILFDGHDIRELNLQHLRSAVSVVSQEVYLFQGTIRENVSYGQPQASEKQIIEAMRVAGAQDLLTLLPGGLDATVGERGRRLSGGERQRVAIARSLLKVLSGASILALDEATSHLDNETEAAVKRSLRKAAAGKNVIMIAHRLSTIRSADRILVLERGKVIEEGKHEELLAREGLYASLWQLQHEDPLGKLEVRIRR